jgi:hypothetical protein
MLHLLPPSPALLRFWLLEGRSLALADSPEGARERWEAIVDEPAGDTIPRIKAEALVRLALLEYATGRGERAAEHVRALESPEVREALPSGWSAWLPNLERVAADSEFGGGSLPVAPALERRKDGQRRERGRREPISNR